MSFVPRTYTQIITDMIAYVQERTGVTDFTVGSVIRTVLEAAALEDDEQYFQMVQMLDIFSYTTAVGGDLDRRLADFNIFRRSSQDAFGKVVFVNNDITKDIAASDTLAGNNTIQLFDSSEFPVPGSTYTIKVAEGTTREQNRVVLSHTTTTNTLTLSSNLSSDVLVGDRVSIVSGSSIVVPSSTNVEAPATATENSKMYRTTETATISSGSYYSNEVAVVSTLSGTGGNVGSGKITQFTSGPPFKGAGVTNFSAISGGKNRESDQDFRARAVEKLQSLSRGTVLALKSNSIGVSDPGTGQRVISSNVLENFAGEPDEVIVYIDDGSGLIPDKVVLAQSVLASDVTASAGTVVLVDASDFPSSGTVLVGDDFLAEYVSKETNTLTLASAGPASPSAVTGDVVRKVDVISTGVEQGQRRFNLKNPPIIRNTARIYIKHVSDPSWVLLEENTDYVLNKGTGEFAIVDEGGLASTTQVVATYSYYTNLVAEVQKVLEGSSGDSVNYPGVKAAGVFLSVEAPIFKRVTVRVTISAEDTFVEANLAPLVKQEIETYINSLKIGEDVITSRIVDVSHNVTGVRSVSVQLPVGNVTVLENELPVAVDSNQNSLVTVL